MESLENGQEQEINDLLESLKLDHDKYVEYKIIYDILENIVSKNDHIGDALKSKIQDIMVGESVRQTMTLGNLLGLEESSSLLGLCDLDDATMLSYSEAHLLELEVAQHLSNKLEEVSNEFYKVTNRDIIKSLKNNSDQDLRQISVNDKVLLSHKEKLLLVQEEYIKNLIELMELLEEISKLRLNVVPHVVEQKTKEWGLKNKVNHLKSSLILYKNKRDVFKETNCSLHAYREIIKDIKKGQQDCQKEIEELGELKEKYNQVFCKQYEEILCSYLQRKAKLEKNKIIRASLK